MYDEWNDETIDTVAFGLDEYGYYSLYPHTLLQDTLSRVRNYKRYRRYLRPSVPPEAFARIQVHHNEFYIQSFEYTIGTISESTYEHLKHMNPAISK